MKECMTRFMKGCTARRLIPAGGAVALLSLIGLLAIPTSTSYLASMYFNPQEGIAVLGETLTVDIMVDARVPVNVFSGMVLFDHKTLRVESISYNTSVADLWAELPWYENGDGTIHFGGGTTKKGGFQGEGSLLTVTFRALGKGGTTLTLSEARMLEHNGLGTDIEVVSFDALFDVQMSDLPVTTITPVPQESKFFVVEDAPQTDLNGDGRQTIADMSIFVLNMFSKDLRFDFNKDGMIDGKDMQILIGAR